ncbi:unnamed protein product, partial [Mesorhabditis belari]|uniref:Uncharacterized protein n=1 Tax=Mesorhabditis belari TaxID=2138241 RepID=A0AAF3J1R1_9BILA
MSSWFLNWLAEPFYRLSKANIFSSEDVCFWFYVFLGAVEVILLYRFFRIRVLLKENVFQAYLLVLSLYLVINVSIYGLYLSVAFLNTIDVDEYVFLRPLVGKMEEYTAAVEFLLYASFKIDRLCFMGTTAMFLLLSMCTYLANKSVYILLTLPSILNFILILTVQIADTIQASDFFYNTPLILYSLAVLGLLFLNMCLETLPLTPVKRIHTGRRLFIFVVPLLLVHFKLIEVAWSACKRWFFHDFPEYSEFVDAEWRGNYDSIYEKKGKLYLEYESPARQQSIFCFHVLPLLTLLWIFVILPEYRAGLVDRRGVKVTPEADNEEENNNQSLA